MLHCRAEQQRNEALLNAEELTRVFQKYKEKITGRFEKVRFCLFVCLFCHSVMILLLLCWAANSYVIYGALFFPGGKILRVGMEQATCVSITYLLLNSLHSMVMHPRKLCFLSLSSWESCVLQVHLYNHLSNLSKET